MLNTLGGKFGGYGLYLVKGKPVFTYVQLTAERFRWESPAALTPGKHTIVFDFQSDGRRPGEGGTGKLSKLTIKLVPPERSAKEENLIRKQTQQVVNAGQ